VGVDLLVRGRRGGHPAGRRAHRRRTQPRPRSPRRAGRAGDQDAMTGSPGPAGDPGPAYRCPGLAVEVFRGHGMGRDRVEPDWPPLTDEEVSAVLARYGRPGGAAVRWRSPRPMSAAALAGYDGAEVFVKRHHALVRTGAQLSAEHALADHLRALGVAVPAVLRLPGGGTTVASGDYVYEVHAVAAGIDLYRDVLSWEPFTSAQHARAAGAALARFHRASASFGMPERAPAVLTNSCAVITAPDPLAELGRLAARRPGLASYLDARPWRDDFTRYHLPAIGQLAPSLPDLGRLWGHGDWHPSNLTWDSASPDAGVAAVIDLGLANRTFAAHDLAVAIERSAVSWLDLAEKGWAPPRHPRRGRPPRWLPGRALAQPGRACRAAAAAPRRAHRVRAVRGRILRQRGALIHQRRPRLPHLPRRAHPLVRHAG